jgi:hypothetical protein
VVTRTKIVLFAFATLLFAAWMNAAQEKRGCASCSPAIGAACTLEDLAKAQASEPWSESRKSAASEKL